MAKKQGDDYEGKPSFSMAPRFAGADEGKTQVDLIPVETEEQIAKMAGEVDSERFTFKAILVVQATDGVTLPHSIPIIHGECVGDRIEEVLHRGIRAAAFKRRLRSIIGEPSKFSEVTISLAKAV